MHMNGDWGKEKEKEFTSCKFTNYSHFHLKNSLESVKTPVIHSSQTLAKDLGV